MNCACPEPSQARDFADTEAIRKLLPGACDLLGLRPWPTEAPANKARLGREVPDLGLAGIHALPDHAALELGKGARDAPSRGCAVVEGRLRVSSNASSSRPRCEK
jgi:hypothetical protein